MPECKYIRTCPFFKNEMKGFGEFNELLKREYCKGSQHECARFQVSEELGPRMVPADMLPSQHQSAHKMLMAYADRRKMPQSSLL